MTLKKVKKKTATANNLRKQILLVLCFSSMYAMEIEVKFGKQEVETKKSLGYYDDDFELTKLQSQNQQQPSIPKPYISDDDDKEPTTCCSLLWLFVEQWNHNHVYLYPIYSPNSSK